MHFQTKIVAIATVILLSLANSAWTAPAKKKNTRKSFNENEAVENLNQALLICDIDAADDIIDSWNDELQRSKKKTTPEFEKARSKKMLTENMLERVESLKFLGRENIPADKLLNKQEISLPISFDAGKLYGSEWVIQRKDLNGNKMSTAHIPADGREIFWTREQDGNQVIWQAGILLDGTLDNPHPIFNISDSDEPVIMTTPFMSADGLTLYFSANISGSIGGLDIFRAVRQGVGQPFESPMNMGMPYNSAANDILYVSDPLTSASFFATDRTTNPLNDYAADSVYTNSWTVYTFIPNETRINREPDFEDPTLNLSQDEFIDSFIAGSIPAGFDANTIRERINLIRENQDIDPDMNVDYNFEFSLYIPKFKKTYHNLDDFKSAEARQTMIDALDVLDELAGTQSKLAELRERYASGQRENISTQIIAIEKQLPVLRQKSRNLLNTAITIESSTPTTGN